MMHNIAFMRWVVCAALVLVLAGCGTTDTPAPATTAPVSAAATTGAPTTAPVATAIAATPTLAPLATSTATPATTAASSAPTAAPTTAPARLFDHIVIVMMENADYAASMAQPALAQMAKSGALLTNFYAETHPSYPNYLALVGGSTFGVTSDGVVDLDKSNLADLLDGAHLTWKTYAEALPGKACYGGVITDTYVRKHEPFVSFTNIQTNPARCANITNATAFKTDLAAGTLPNCALYVPDLNDDGHDTGVIYGANWLQKFMPPLLADPHLPANTLFVVTYDEGYGGGTNQIYTAFLGTPVKPGATSATRYSHYDLLRTVEDNFGLGTLGREDAKASAITGIWANRP